MSDVLRKAGEWSDSYGGILRLVMVAMSTLVAAVVSFAWGTMLDNSFELREMKGQLAAIANLSASIGTMGERMRLLEERTATLEEREKNDARRLDQKRRELDEIHRVLRDLLRDRRAEAPPPLPRRAPRG